MVQVLSTLCHSFSDACEHCCSSRKHNIGIQVLADVNVTLHDRLETRIMNSMCFFSNKTWLEKHFGATETLTANCDDIPIRQFICLFAIRSLRRIFHLSIKIKCYVAKFLFDIAHNFTLSGCIERIATLCENLHEVLCQITAS